MCFSSETNKQKASQKSFINVSNIVFLLKPFRLLLSQDGSLRQGFLSCFFAAGNLSTGATLHSKGYIRTTWKSRSSSLSDVYREIIGRTLKTIFQFSPW